MGPKIRSRGHQETDTEIQTCIDGNLDWKSSLEMEVKAMYKVQELGLLDC